MPRRADYNSHKCLDVPAFSTDDGTIVEQYQCNAGTNQQWDLRANG
ncbi:RICIN domain-containing protein [Nocardia anaemiae]